ncbi:hypothetical protein ARMSODRAFT_948517 [Armillaria solidipes]|uniref:Uncharacterized protein n=1 Tax=Armillaria solidipes TaxID=1076256 RepID=A0A2H3C0S6_9AGAR|nr:hypothetical protein ARMSODRAFT_948517 [Armillaria solidipes]
MPVRLLLLLLPPLDFFLLSFYSFVQRRSPMARQSWFFSFSHRHRIKLASASHNLACSRIKSLPHGRSFLWGLYSSSSSGPKKPDKAIQGTTDVGVQYLLKKAPREPSPDLHTNII